MELCIHFLPAFSTSVSNKKLNMPRWINVLLLSKTKFISLLFMNQWKRKIRISLNQRCFSYSDWSFSSSYKKKKNTWSRWYHASRSTLANTVVDYTLLRIVIRILQCGRKASRYRYLLGLILFMASHKYPKVPYKGERYLHAYCPKISWKTTGHYSRHAEVSSSGFGFSSSGREEDPRTL